MSVSSNTYYIGIGASAGGLEALEAFFKEMPENTGMVFFVIQHLSPDYKSLMSELLARHTAMPIHVATSGTEVRQNNIYLIPPKKYMTIFHRRIQLEDQVSSNRPKLPIDVFFRSLAEDVKNNAIAVVLSGTGSDGTLGIKSIKENGGMVMVQDNKSAKFDGMPRSSLATGLADFVLAPENMPGALIDFLEYPHTVANGFNGNTMNNVASICRILREHTGVDFASYKENTVTRRIERRVKINRYKTVEDYTEYLHSSADEKNMLYKELLIGVTRFFRDEEAFQILKDDVLKSIFENNDSNEIRIWSAGCSTGEEVYSLAIILSEFRTINNYAHEIKIFATDIDKEAIEIASQGIYPESVASDLSAEFLAKYFVVKEGGYQVCESIRGMVVYARHNILEDPPFSKLDLLVCRNLFIYIQPVIQQRILNTFYYALNRSGYLMIGNSESLGEMGEMFKTVSSKWKIFQSRDSNKNVRHTSFFAPRKKMHVTTKPISKMQNLTNAFRMEKLLTEVTSAVVPPTLIVDDNNHIVQVLNDVSDVIQIKPGRFSNDLFSNIKSDLTAFVSGILRKLRTSNEALVVETVAGLLDYEKQTLRIEGRKISVDRMVLFMLSFSFNDSSVQTIHKASFEMNSESYEQITRLEEELQLTKESLQSTVEELETSNEELQSSNEELIASNEELQSTNEELQSVNEELHSVNSEHQSKIDQLTELNNDLYNLIINTGVGAIYLDRQLCIRKLTPIVSKITNLREADLGRPINHLTVMPGYDEILEDIEFVVETLQGIDKEIRDKDGHYWLFKIRPYRTEYNAVDGIILTFVEIDTLKEKQKQMETLTLRLSNVMEMGKIAWWEWNVETGFVEYDARKATMIGYTEDEFPNDVYEICGYIHPEDYEKTMQIMRDHFEGKTEYWDATYRIRRKDGGYAWYYDRGKITKIDENGKPLTVAGSVLDISEIKTLRERQC